METKEKIVVGIMVLALITGASKAYFNHQASEDDKLAHEFSKLAPAAGDNELQKMLEHQKTLEDLKTLQASNASPEEMLEFYKENGFTEIAETYETILDVQKKNPDASQAELMRELFAPENNQP